MEREKVDVVELAKTELSPEEFEQVKPVLEKPSADGLEREVSEEDEKVPPEAKQTDMRTALGKMTMAQRIKAAMFGNGIVRRILILDPSRMIQECVLNNPKLGLNEVEEFVKNPNLSAQLLRSIAGRNTWMRSYRLKVNMVSNPKTPADLSLRLLRFLHENEVKQIARSKNIPQVLQVAAKKKLQEKG